MNRWEALAEIRELRGFRRSDIAARLKVHPSSVGRLEAGVKSLNEEHIKKICAILGINKTFFPDGDYPFTPGGFSLFKVMGSLKYLASPFRWLNPFIEYCTGIQCILLTEGKKAHAALIRDDRGFLALIRIIRLNLPDWQDAYHFWEKLPDGQRKKILILTQTDIGSFLRELDQEEKAKFFVQESEDILPSTREKIEQFIDHTLRYQALNEDEAEVLRIIRKNKISSQMLQKLVNQTSK